MVQAPFAAQAAGGLDHAPQHHRRQQNLPGRSVQRLFVRKSGQAHAGRQRAERQQYAARQRPLPQTKDVEAGNHDTSM